MKKQQMSAITLSASHLSKKYGEFIALDDFCMEFKPGVYGILGANGAGKSTLMNLLTDSIARSQGEILYNGEEIVRLGKRYRSILGYMPQRQGFYDEFSPKTFLFYMAYLKGIPKRVAKKQISSLLETVNLTSVQNKRIGSFSGGMIQRVLLVQALLGDPKIIILDEPTAGLDPKERIRIRNYISSLSKDRIILLATHVVSDIECIAEQVLLMKKGKLIKCGTPMELIESVNDKVAQIACSKEEIASYQENYVNGNIIQSSEGFYFRIVGDEFPTNFQLVSNQLSLEEVYLYYMEYRK